MDEQKQKVEAEQKTEAVPEAVFIGEPVPVEVATPKESLPPEVAQFLEKPNVVDSEPAQIPTTPTQPIINPNIDVEIIPETKEIEVQSVPNISINEPKPVEKIAPPTIEAPKTVSPVSTIPVSNKPLSLQRLRTYKDDVEVAVRAQNLSVAKVFLAEEERRRRNQRMIEVSSPDSPKNKLYLFLTGLLVLISLAGFVYFKFFLKQNPVGDLNISTPSFIRSDSTELVDATDKPIRDLATKIRTTLIAPIVDREVREVIIATGKRDIESGEIIFNRVPSRNLLAGIGATPPDGLIRSLTDDYFVGTYGGKNGPIPMILLTVDDHSVAFAGMLEWETNLARDLSDIFPRAWSYVSSEPRPTIETPRVQPSTTTQTIPASITKTLSSTNTTSTGTPVITPQRPTIPTVRPGSRNTFTDIIVGNKDTRVIYNQNRQPLILYSFIEPNIILITDDPLLVSEISRRLSLDKQLH